MSAADAKVRKVAIPMIAYEDVAAAIPWLESAFGFREDTDGRYTEPDGRVTHAQLELDGAVVMLGWPGANYQSPARHVATCAAAAKWSELPYVIDGVVVYVDDVDAHHRRARNAGAVILMEPRDQPYGRLYNAADLEGHRWMFLQAPVS